MGGSSIVEGGFDRSVSLAAWERQIRNVGGEMGFGPCEECVEKCMSSHQIRKCAEGKMEAENILRLGKLILQSN